MAATSPIDFHAYPDASGHFGRYGGRFVAETLIGPLQELAAAYDAARVDPDVHRRVRATTLRITSAGRARSTSPSGSAREVGGARILLKREDLNHTGAHKINNTIGQALLASRMGKTRIIAETGAGQHGVASATVAARLGLECVVYMGATDIERQKINVYRMKLLGAKVVPVTSGVGHAQGRAQRGDARLGDERAATPSTSSAPWPARIRIRAWCATSMPWSGARHARRCWPSTGACPMR